MLSATPWQEPPIFGHFRQIILVPPERVMNESTLLTAAQIMNQDDQRESANLLFCVPS